MKSSSPSITQLLQDWRNGDAAALDRLTPLVYGELRRVAGAYVARHGSPLQATEVVNEVFRRLMERDQVAWPDRKHFFAFCATVIRNILVDHFQEQKLGQGGFGVVFLARGLNLLSRLVVVKVLRPEAGRGQTRITAWVRRKFHGEIDALTRFRHEHIVGILDQGELPGGDPFLVMDYIEGESLRSAMKREKIGFARVAGILRQTGQALSYAHRRFVLHRDLLAGTLAAGIVGYLSIAFFLSYLCQRTLGIFIAYRLLEGVTLWHWFMGE